MLAGHMSRQGHAVTLVNLRDEQHYPIPEGVHFLPSYDTRSRRLRKVGEITRRARLLERLLAEHPPWDLIVSTLLPADRIVGRTSIGGTAWYRIPNTLSVEMLQDHRDLKRSRRHRRIRKAYEGKKVIAVSDGVLRDLTDELGISTAARVTINNPFDIEELRSLAAEPCSLAGGDYLVHVGRFGHQKRHDRLFGALARSAYKGRLVLVGSGSQREVASLAELVEASGLAHRIELAGFQENPYPYVRHARALVLSSDYEGFPNVLVEALICGTPVVSTRCRSGPDEILTGDLATGLADLDEESLSAAIDRVLENPPAILPEHYARFKLDAIAERYLALAE
jgi:glycosyltransferase involved in cell wall biosynthesis